MSTQMVSNTRFSLTRFWGGTERGSCLQVTAPTAGRNPYMDEGFVQVTREEALLLAETLLRFANGTLEEDE
jgi:hypothetical protein